jgi:selenocysteine-specific elongation factor
MAMVFLSEPAVATNQQSFVIRAESPAQTIGGGRVLNPNADRQMATSPLELEMLAELSSAEDANRLAASIYFTPIGQWRIEDAPRLAAVIDPEKILEKIKADGRISQVQVSPSQQVWVHSERITQLAERIRQALDYLHNEHPLKWDFSLTTIEQRFDYLPYRAIFDAALRELKSKKVVDVRDSRISLVGRGPKLAKGERQLLDELLNRIRSAGIEPPDLNQLRVEASRHKEAVPNLLALAVGAGDLYAITPELFVHRDTIDEVRKKLMTAFPANSGFTLSQMREALSTSRKYAVPLAEQLDKLGFTRRENDLRFIRSDVPAPSLAGTDGSNAF